MRIGRFLFPVMVMAVLLLFMSACGSESPEEIASQVARDWTSSNITKVSSALVEMVPGDVPILGELAASVINNQINQHLTWTYSEPVKISEGRYRVAATASTSVNVNLLIVQEDYRVSADLVLLVDTEKKQVQTWELDIGSFKATEL